MRRIYVDCSHTYFSGLNTGIQRVVRNTVNNIDKVSKDLSIDIIPVIYNGKAYYKFEQFPVIDNTFLKKKNNLKEIVRKIYKFTRNIVSLIPFLKDIFYIPRLNIFLNKMYDKLFFPKKTDKELQVKPKEKDIVLLLDTTWCNIEYKYYKELKKDGVIIVALIYDIIPITNKEFCSVDLTMSLYDWYKNIHGITDGYLSISNYVSKELYKYIKKEYIPTISANRFDFFHLGVDFNKIKKNNIITQNYLSKYFNKEDTFLTVSTIEPRKNHQYILNVFEELWEKGYTYKYIMVGRVGWKVDDFINKVQSHKEYNKKLFLFTDLNDEQLQYAYLNSKALVFASFVEGFGLPIIESLYNKLQVLASDIPIHREIGQEFVTYFDLNKTSSLRSIIEKNNYDKNLNKFYWKDWYESTKELFSKVSRMVES